MGRHKRVRAVLAFCLTVAAAGLSCSGPVVTAVGNSNDLVIIHAADHVGLIEPVVSAMESPEGWLLDEPLFEPTLAIPKSARDSRNIRHIMLVGTWNEPDLVGLVRQAFPSLGPDDPVTLRMTEDVWAKGQLVGAIVGRTEADVLAFVSERGDQAARDFARAAVLRLARRLRNDGDASGMTAALEERFGWSIAPPTGYDFFTTNEAERFVFFRRVRPDRSVFVYWEEGQPDAITEELAIAWREELARRYYDGDTVERRRPLDVQRVDFLGRDAIRISGWWGNRELVGGGTFRSYCFYEPTQDRTYMIDTSLFAPGFDKISLMRNLDAIAHTFSSAAEGE